MELYGRGERIRTSDPLVPNQVLYQAEPLPEVLPTISGMRNPPWQAAIRGATETTLSVPESGKTPSAPRLHGGGAPR